MKRTYSKEFKVKACELVIKDNISPPPRDEKIPLLRSRGIRKNLI